MNLKCVQCCASRLNYIAWLERMHFVIIGVTNLSLALEFWVILLCHIKSHYQNCVKAKSEEMVIARTLTATWKFRLFQGMVGYTRL